MSLLEALQTIKNELKPTVTTVVLEDGTEVEEKRDASGAFVSCNGSETGNCSNDATVSKRREKKVKRAQRMGFVVDLQPDLQLALCCPGIYVGSQDAAHDFEVLKTGGITHIVNCATGVGNIFNKHFRYYSMNILDLPTTQLRGYFPSAHEFMNNAVQNGGKVLVHCNAGISRSTTFVISYMMKFHGHTAHSALEEVRKTRSAARPNDGFMQQLLMFEDELQIQ